VAPLVLQYIYCTSFKELKAYEAVIAREELKAYEELKA
jgi:hypothetical protein